MTPPVLATQPTSNQQGDKIVLYIENNEDGEAPCLFTPVTMQAQLDTGSGVSLIPVSTQQQLRSAGMGCISHCIEKVQVLCTNNHGCWACSNHDKVNSMSTGTNSDL